MVDEAAMGELRTICPGAQEINEGGIAYILLPELKLPCAPAIVEALLCIQQHGGYTTRLFLAQQVPGPEAASLETAHARITAFHARQRIDGFCVEHDVPVYPGVATATEIEVALRSKKLETADAKAILGSNLVEIAKLFLCN